MTPAAEDHKWRHDVGLVSRLRLHRELAAEYETCPYCGEDLLVLRHRKRER